VILSTCARILEGSIGPLSDPCMRAQDPATFAIGNAERGILDCSESLLILGRAGEITIEAFQ